MDIELNVINHSNDANNQDIVIFQRNIASDSDEEAVAWKVIQNLGHGWNHPFKYIEMLEVAASDAYGNYTPRLSTQNGQTFGMHPSNSGDVLELEGPSANPNEIEINNGLETGEISAGIYRSGSLLAAASALAPTQKAVFGFKPVICIGVVSQIEEGQVMNSAIISQVNTEISLLGIASADIVLTGGGPGPTSKPFQFDVQNVVEA